MRASTLSLTPLLTHDLSISYDAVTAGVLVLSLQQPCGRPDNKKGPWKLRAHYCNGAAAAMFGLTKAETGAKPSTSQTAALNFLEITEPALARDIADHLQRIGSSNSSHESNHVLVWPMSARRWHEVVLEPVRLVSDAPDDEGDGAPNTETHSASNRLSRMWRIATCCGVPYNRNSYRKSWPAVVVTFRQTGLEHARTCTGFCTGPGSLTDEASVVTGLSARSARASVEVAVSSFRKCLSPSSKVNMDTDRSYEQMVLSALTPIITAVTTDGRRVVYQNGLSVAYFGRRIPPRTPSGRHQEAAEVRPDAVEVLVDHDGPDAVGGVLAELFSLEPEKLERMIAETCRHGHVWRGIVRVPHSCNSQPCQDALTRAGSVHCLSPGAPSRNSTLSTQHHGHQALRTAKSVRRRGSSTMHVMEQLPMGTLLCNESLAAEPAVGSCAKVEQEATHCSRVSTKASSVYEDCIETAHTIEADPLATSTWGLLMAGASATTTEHGRGRGSASTFVPAMCTGPFGSSDFRHDLFPQNPAPDQGASSLLSNAQQPQGRQPEQEEPPAQQFELLNQHGKLTISKAERPAAKDNDLQANNVLNRDAPSWILRAPRMPSATSHHLRISMALNVRRSTDLLVVMSRITSAALASPSFNGGHESEKEHLKGLLRARATSMTTQHKLQHGRGLASVIEGENYAQRCFNWQDFPSLSSSQAGITSHVMAFASTLRTTPPVVQQVLQQAMAGGASTVGWHNNTSVLGSGADWLEGNGPSGGGEVKDSDMFLPMSAGAAKGTAASSTGSLLRPQTKHTPLGDLAATCSTPSPTTSLALGAAPVAPPRPASTFIRSLAGNRAFRQQDSHCCVPGEETMTYGQRSRTDPSIAVGVLDRSNSSGVRKPQQRLQASVKPITAARPTRGNNNPATSHHSDSFPALASHNVQKETACSSFSCCVDASTSKQARDDAETVLLLPCKQSPQPSADAASAASPCWHEVAASRAVDPHTGQPVVVVSQINVSAKVAAERHLALVTETEHRLLEQIFPRHVLACLTEEGGPLQQLAAEGPVAPCPPAPCSAGGVPRDINRLATSHAEVTLLFADIQGFTPMCKELEPRVVMTFLNDLFTRFDHQLDEFGVYKVETIGDCYFVAGGLVHEDEDGMAAVRARESHADPAHAEKVFLFAKAMLSAASNVRLPTTGGPVRVRIGLHTGPVVSGLVGERMPRFCLFGDTVNTASRMESTGVPGCIHVSEATWALLPKEGWTSTGGIEVKGKGLMNTYLWAPPDQESQALLASHITESLAARSKAGRGSGGAGSGSGGCLQPVLRQRQSMLPNGHKLPPPTVPATGSERRASAGTGGTSSCSSKAADRHHDGVSGSFPLTWFAYDGADAAAAVRAHGKDDKTDANMDPSFGRSTEGSDGSAARLAEFLFCRH